MGTLNGISRIIAQTLEASEVQGIFATDYELRVIAWNRWMECHSGLPAGKVLGKELLELFPSLRERRLVEQYQQVLAGQVKVLADRFHRYLIPMRPVGTKELEYMRQSACIMPLRFQDSILGTITFLEDVTERALREAEIRRYMAELQRTRDRMQQYLAVAGVMFVVLDAAGRLQLVNRQACQILGWDEQELLGRDWFTTCLPEEEQQSTREIFSRLLAGELHDHEYVEGKIRRRDGTTRIIAWHNTLLRDDHQQIVGTLSSGEDITERKQMEAALAWQAEVNAAMADLAQALLSPTSLADITLRVLEQARKLTGSAFGQISHGDSAPSVITAVPEDTVACQAATGDFKNQFQALCQWAWHYRKPLLLNDLAPNFAPAHFPGSLTAIRQFLMVPVLHQGRLLGQIALANPGRDYTPADQQVVERLATLYALAYLRVAQEEELRYLASHDSLTGLLNRRGFLSLAERELKLARRHQYGLWLMFIDLDDLKWINDHLGHQDGDRALQILARLLRDSFRSTDIIGRLGGDEFGLLAAPSEAESGPQLAARLLAAVAEFNQNHQEWPMRLSVSVGLSYFDPDRPCSLNDLLRSADEQMYAAKKAKSGGPNRQLANREKQL